jgi:hypothetical protein
MVSITTTVVTHVPHPSFLHNFGGLVIIITYFIFISSNSAPFFFVLSYAQEYLSDNFLALLSFPKCKKSAEVP